MYEIKTLRSNLAHEEGGGGGVYSRGAYNRASTVLAVMHFATYFQGKEGRAYQAVSHFCLTVKPPPLPPTQLCTLTNPGPIYII